MYFGDGDGDGREFGMVVGGSKEVVEVVVGM
jgi:hypothetical protein